MTVAAVLVGVTGVAMTVHALLADDDDSSHVHVRALGAAELPAGVDERDPSLRLERVLALAFRLRPC